MHKFDSCNSLYLSNFFFLQARVPRQCERLLCLRDSVVIIWRSNSIVFHLIHWLPEKCQGSLFRTKFWNTESTWACFSWLREESDSQNLFFSSFLNEAIKLCFGHVCTNNGIPRIKIGSSKPKKTFDISLKVPILHLTYKFKRRKFWLSSCKLQINIWSWILLELSKKVFFAYF